MPGKSNGHPLRLSDRVGTIHVPSARRGRVSLRARYDNAETTDLNRRHWANADNGSADAHASKWARDKLAARCRYECRNNSWASGVKNTLANDTVGTGPRLQMLTGDPDLNTQIETDFWAWSQEIGLPVKLRTMRAARVDSGECFGLISNNPALMSDVKIDIDLVEPEQVAAPFMPLPKDDGDPADGIAYDQYGNPVFYTVLREHPGGNTGSLPTEFDRWDAKFVLHYFRPDRPGQLRGVPDLTPAVDQFAELRRYSKAVIAAAEAVADHALVVTTNSEDNMPNEAGEVGQDSLSAMDQMEIGRYMAVTLPKGYTMGQVKAEQPAQGYKEFVDCKLAEIARCLNMPFCFAALDTGANMSATYVVGQKYERTITVDRSDLECLLNRLLDLWLVDWVLVSDTLIKAIFPTRMRGRDLSVTFDRVWQWDKIGNHADPGKVANARQVELSAGTTNIPREYAKEGLDWESEQEADAKSMGITVDELRKRILDKRFGPTAPTTAPPPQTAQESDNANA